MTTEPDISVDVELWARAREWTWREAEYLLVGIDPRKVEKIDREVELDLKDSDRTRVREELQFQFRLDDVPQRVSPTEALKIILATDINPPSELVDAVRRAEEQRKAVDVIFPAQKAGQTKKYNKLLKMFLVAAIQKYQWRPSTEKQSAVTNFLKAAELLGLPSDDRTVRARLDEALNRLTDKEKKSLGEKLSISPAQIEAYLQTRK